MRKTDKCSILGITIDRRSKTELDAAVRKHLMGTSFHRIATVNPEFAVLAKRNDAFLSSLLSADIRIADGTGIAIAGLLSGCHLTRYPGADFLKTILATANRQESTVYLAIRKDGLSSFNEIRTILRTSFPRLHVRGADLNPISFSLPDGIRDADIVLCNFGAPEQEYFLESLRHTDSTVRLAMGVGGSFDFLTGKRKRAPEWIQSIGLEWLFRLLIQPKRILRIWTATVIFPFLCLSDRISNSR